MKHQKLFNKTKKNTHTSQEIKSDRKNGKRHEKQNLPRKVALTMPKVPRFLGNARAPRSNLKNEL